MKSEALKTWIDRHAAILSEACHGTAAAEIRKLSAVLAARPGSTVTQLCTTLQDLTLPDGHGAPTLGETSKLISLMVRTADGIAKAGEAKDLKRFEELIFSWRDSSIDAFVAAAVEKLKRPPAKRKGRSAGAPALSDAEFRTYVHRLEVALGDDPGFQKVYSEISGDARVKAAIAKKIAKAFTGKAGTSKADALGRIYHRHSSLMSSRSKKDAVGGRSAA